ncbi:hypothetical protein AS200_03895 [Streptomyces sp. CdTB01]|nr:hypothetical protein AS200_03895 [Streptomyces sp. CdTB01]
MDDHPAAQAGCRQADGDLLGLGHDMARRAANEPWESGGDPAGGTRFALSRRLPVGEGREPAELRTAAAQRATSSRWSTGGRSGRDQRDGLPCQGCSADQGPG